MADQPKADLSVVIARFQTPALTQAHESLLQLACRNGNRVLILLGCSNMITKRNPLPFNIRSEMVWKKLREFGGGLWEPNQVHILPLIDHSSNEAWASQVDGIVSAVAAGGSVRFCWGHDSAQATYIAHGRYKDHLRQENAAGWRHASEVRKAVHPPTGSAYKGTEALFFRQGAIWQQERQFVNPWPTVDMIVTQSPSGLTEVLLGQKDSDGDKWRFPGGFVDPGDINLETAARRELREECGDIETDPVYIGSIQIADWRLRDCRESIITSVFHCPLKWGNVKAGDDLKRIAWFRCVNVGKVIHSVHKPVWELAQDNIKIWRSK